MPTVSHRGVWCITPCTDGQTVILVYDRRDRLVTAPVVVPTGTDPDTLTPQLWDVLNAADPGPLLTACLPPAFRRLDRRLRTRSHLKAI